MLHFTIIDNTHTVAPNSPGYLPEDTITIMPYGTFEKDGWHDYKISLSEHCGTHIDAPLHFGGPGYLTIDQIPPESLVGPAVIVDVRDGVANNIDYELTVADLQAWEKYYGLIPKGAVVVMFSGWQDRWNEPEAYINNQDGVYHFPGFSVDAIQWLLNNRDINGIGVDTVSFDHGLSRDYRAHKLLLKANKWALENLANLDKTPPQGALMVVGPMKHKGGSGGPARVYTFINK